MSTNKKNIPHTKSGQKSQIITEDKSQQPLERKNFIGMAIAGVLIVVGFLLMLGDSSTTDQFNPDIFSTRRVVIGPFIAFAGFVLMAIALILSPSTKHKA